MSDDDLDYSTLLYTTYYLTYYSLTHNYSHHYTHYSLSFIRMRQLDPAEREAATALKVQGNKAFSSHEWPAAIDLYSKAIEKYDQDPSFFCNRAQVRLLPPVRDTVTNKAGPYQTRGVRVRDCRRDQRVGVGPRVYQGLPPRTLVRRQD